MDSKTKNGLISVGLVAITGYLAYRFFIKPNSKKVVLSYLNATYCGMNEEHSTFVNNASKSYLDAWSEAIMNGECTFVDKATNKTYVTLGGKVKV